MPVRIFDKGNLYFDLESVMGMIQERKELILGLQFEETYSQLTCYTGSMKEPMTVSAGENGDSYLLPVTENEWKAAIDVSHPLEELTEFFRRCLKLLPETGAFSDIRIMVTVPKLKAPLAERIPGALEQLGISRKYIFLQDYKSSFYYYTVNQKRELWNGDVALLEYQQQTMTAYVLHVDRSTKPALVTVEQAASQRMDDTVRDGREEAAWDKERDRLFFELLKKAFERRNVVTSYLLGDYFDRSWAERSFQYLCYHRHAFQGKNLYTKGACYAAMERVGLVNVPDLLFMGADIIHENMGMNMRIRGKEVYYPLITAGVNWYEAHHVCEFIPDGEDTIAIITKPMTGGQEVQHLLRLKGMPDRPNRATRLKMTVYFVSASRCVVEVEDMGFGGFYRPSGKHWQREINFETGE